MTCHFTRTLPHAARSVILLACLGALGACGNSDTGPLYSNAPLAPTPHVAGDPPPRMLRSKANLGAMDVEAVQIVAEVTAVDVSKRRITLLMPDGKSQTITAAKEMTNLDTITVGDRVGCRVVEETALFIRRDGEPPSVQEADVMGIKVRGGPPAAFESEAVEVTTRVVSVDAAKQQVRLLFPNGREATVNVHHAIDLTKVKPGDDLVSRVSERMIVEVVKQ